MPETAERTEERQTLHGLATWLMSMDEPGSSARQSVTLAEIIEQAKLALEADEGRTEYRVTGQNKGCAWERSATTPEQARAIAETARAQSFTHSVRIQSAEVTETRTPWVDLDEGEGGDG